MFLGLPACLECAGSGYLDNSELAPALADAKAANISNFAGAMLWDGPMALANVQGKKDYLTLLREAL